MYSFSRIIDELVYVVSSKLHENVLVMLACDFRCSIPSYNYVVGVHMKSLRSRKTLADKRMPDEHISGKCCFYSTLRAKDVTDRHILGEARY